MIVIFADIVYALCALTAATCAFLLLRGYRRSGVALLLWAGLCFIGLTLNNVALFVDRVLVPHLDLWPARQIPAALGICALLYGLIWESDG